MSAPVAAGSVVANFRVESLIGQGAMGGVYLAEDTTTGRQVALKLLPPELAQDQRFRQRFLRESQLAASLDDPHIVPMLAFGEDAGVLYLAMAYMDGLDLREILRREGRLEPERALRLLAQVAKGLDAAHAAGLVHRDVKPGNILVTEETEEERAYICDFGLARHVTSVSSLSGDRGFVGTIDYVPPEQIKGGPIDGRADVYALGCVLYECLVGARPFDRESELSVVFAHLNEPPPRLSDSRPDLPEAFDDVFATALAKSPDERYSTCDEVVEAAQGAIQGRTVAPRRRHRGRIVLAGIASIILVVAAIGGILTTRGGSDSTTPSITPTSIAGAPLGLRRAAYEQILGKGVRVEQPEEPGRTGYATVAFERPKVWVFFPDGFDAPGEIIVTWNEEFKTATGIGPCSTIDELEAAYGDKVRPDYFGTIGQKHFMYDVGRSLLFAATGPPPPPGQKPVPGKYVSAVGLFDGGAPHADEAGGPRNFAGFVTGNETPQCIP
jgi:tRNA A-37 threonylcarbamoyl transferase component Bud32